MLLACPTSLARVLEPHLRGAAERDPHFAMFNASPQVSSGEESSDEDGDTRLHKSADAAAPGSASCKGAAASAPGAVPPRQQRVAFNRQPAATHTFTHVPVAASAPAATAASSLTAALQAARQPSGGGQGADIASGGPTKRIRVFGAPVAGGVLKLNVAADATIISVIALALGRRSSVGRSDAAAVADGVSAYQLLMADEDGEPDDDMVPSRSQRARDFGADFALVRASPQRAAKQAEEDAAWRAQYLEGASGAAGATGGAGALLRVHLPRVPWGAPERIEEMAIKYDAEVRRCAPGVRRPHRFASPRS